MAKRKSGPPAIEFTEDGKLLKAAAANAVLKDFEIFADELNNESDRAAAVLSAAFLDLHLHRLIRVFLVDDAKECDELIGTELSGGDKPIGTFSARIRAAYCLGLISKIEHHNLELVRRIRNEFAHKLHGLTFESSAIKERCLQFTSPIRMTPDQTPPRQLFNITTHYLAYSILLRQVEVVTTGQRRMPAIERTELFGRKESASS